MMSDDELVHLYRRVVLMSQLAKHAVFGEEPVSATLSEEELGMVRAAVEQADTDVATVFSELRIYRGMFSSKLEAWKHGRADSVGETPQPISVEPRAGTGSEAVAPSPDVGGGGDDGERPDRPNPAPHKGRSAKGKKKVE